MVRNDLVTSAVEFLRDPSVATSTNEKKVAFLKAKNLTEDEIDAAFARANELQSDAPSVGRQQGAYPTAFPQRSPPSYGHGYGYGPYQGAPWGPPPPPPGRDWRDWFIMATVTSGVGYGIYTAAKKYIVPLIAPPTPPQLEKDKAAIDEEFNRAFALIDQLASDTAVIKAAERERAEKLDTTLKDIDAVVADLKAANLRRESESRAVSDQVRELKSMIPEALQNWKNNGDARLDDLATEIASLKKLLENRVGKTIGSASLGARGYPSSGINGQVKQFEEKANPENRNVSPTPQRESSSTSLTSRESPSKSFTSTTERKAAIPAWQMAAANKKSDSDTNV